MYKRPFEMLGYDAETLGNPTSSNYGLHFLNRMVKTAKINIITMPMCVMLRQVTTITILIRLLTRPLL